MFSSEKNEKTFSTRKIPTVEKDTNIVNLNDSKIDEIKILELSNLIDEWEKEILFSDKGFYSLKGIETKEKLKEFVIELDAFISAQIVKMKFNGSFFKEMAAKIKTEKINAIKKEMQRHQQEQLYIWEMDVYEKSLSSSISRAILYKSDDFIVSSSFQNGLNILNTMAEKGNWSKKNLKFKQDKYKSEFFSSLINAFIQDKDAKANAYFSKYKSELLIEDKDILESSIKELKSNIISYNWAKELFSFGLSDKEQEREISEIRDPEIETMVRKYLSDFVTVERKQKEENDKKKNKDNWNEILKVVSENPQMAALYIDYAGKKENINAKKQYIKLIKKFGYISTDKKKFIDLLSEFFKDFEEFKLKDISNYLQYFSDDDYTFFLNLQKLDNTEFEKLSFDFHYLLKKTEEIKIKTAEDKYIFTKLMFSAKEEYKKNNKKEPDLKARNEIIDLISERFKQQRKNEKEGK